MTNKQLIGLSCIALAAGFIWFFPPMMEAAHPTAPTNATYTAGYAELTTGSTKHVLKVEIADTPKAWEQGLMFRNDWGDIQGMLFMFNEEKPVSFWMKNTELSLDVLFFDSSGNIANIAKNTTPMSQKLIPSLAPVKYVLEIAAGQSDQLGFNDATTLHIDTQNEAE